MLEIRANDSPQVFSSAHGRCGSPDRTVSYPQRGRADPQTEPRFAGTASSVPNTAAPQTPSPRRTSFKLQLQWGRDEMKRKTGMIHCDRTNEKS